MNKLGQVGIDWITISNVVDWDAKFPEPLIDFFQTMTQRDLKNDPFVIVHKKKIVFKMGNFALVCGNFTQSYSNLEIHAADPSGNNLYNMSMADIYDKVLHIIDYFRGKYGIKFRNMKDFRVSKLEINKTLQMDNTIDQYAACLALLHFGFNGEDGHYGVYYNRHNMVPELETIYLVDGSQNYAIKAYDKIKELEFKNCVYSEAYKNCLRMEITIKKQCELKSIIPDMKLNDLSDGKIGKYFYKKFENAIFRAESYLQKRLKNSLVVENGKEIPSICQIFMDVLLEHGMYHDAAYRNFFLRIIEIEHLMQLPFFMSMMDLEVIFSDEKFFPSEKMEECFRRMRECEIYQNFEKREKEWNELKSKLWETHIG